MYQSDLEDVQIKCGWTAQNAFYFPYTYKIPCEEAASSTARDPTVSGSSHLSCLQRFFTAASSLGSAGTKSRRLQIDGIEDLATQAPLSPLEYIASEKLPVELSAEHTDQEDNAEPLFGRQNTKS